MTVPIKSNFETPISSIAQWTASHPTTAKVLHVSAIILGLTLLAGSIVVMVVQRSALFYALGGAGIVLSGGLFHLSDKITLRPNTGPTAASNPQGSQYSLGYAAPSQDKGIVFPSERPPTPPSQNSSPDSSLEVISSRSDVSDVSDDDFDRLSPDSNGFPAPPKPGLENGTPPPLKGNFSPVLVSQYMVPSSNGSRSPTSSEQG